MIIDGIYGVNSVFSIIKNLMVILEVDAFSFFEKFKADVLGAVTGFECDVILVDRRFLEAVNFEEVGLQSYFFVPPPSLLPRSPRHLEA